MLVEGQPFVDTSGRICIFDAGYLADGSSAGEHDVGQRYRVRTPRCGQCHHNKAASFGPASRLKVTHLGNAWKYLNGEALNRPLRA